MTKPNQKIGIILLGAGLSKRMGTRNKLLIEVGGQPMIRKVAGELLAADIGPVILVTGHQQDAVADALANLPISSIHNKDYKSGQMATVRTGCLALTGRADLAGVMIALGDMPSLTSTDYRTLYDAFVLSGADQIAIPYLDGARGNPIIVPWRMVREIVEGDLNAGCRKLVASRPDDILGVTVTEPAFIADVDNPDDLTRLTGETTEPMAG